MKCKKCESEKLHMTEQKFKNGTVHLRAECMICGSFVGYAPSVPDNEFVMPFGPNRGTLLTKLVREKPAYVKRLLASPSMSKGIATRIMRIRDRDLGGANERAE